MYGADKSFIKIAEAGGEKGVTGTGALFVSGFLAGAYIAAGFFLSVTAAASVCGIGTLDRKRAVYVSGSI